MSHDIVESYFPKCYNNNLRIKELKYSFNYFANYIKAQCWVKFSKKYLSNSWSQSLQ